VISDRLVVAWAGDTRQARTILQSIADLDQQDQLTFDALDELIDRSKAKIKDSVALIGVFITKDKRGDITDFKWFDFNGDLKTGTVNNTFYDVMVAGTGKTKFLQLLNDLLPTFESTDDMLAHANQLAASLISTFFPNEILTGGNLMEWWGGAFEIATFCPDAKAICKVSDIMFTFWRVVPGKNNSAELALIPRFIKQSYFSDALVIQDLKAVIAKGKLQQPLLHAHVVLPLLKSKENYDFNLADFGDFSHKMLCIFILPEESVAPEDIVVRVFWNAKGEDNFHIDVTTKTLHLKISNDLINTIESDISAVLEVPVKLSMLIN
jgi:hypothetical protein